MKILVYISSAWQGYISNKMIALISAMQRDAEFVMALDYQCEQCAVDAVLSDQYCPPSPPWIPADAVRMRLGGDLHRFSVTEQETIASNAAGYETILTAYRFAAPVNPPACYYWPSESVRSKLVFFPHCVPDGQPPPFNTREGGLLSGSDHSDVYPWRAWLKSLDLPCVDVIPHPGYDNPAAMTAARESYFATLSRYAVGFTCHAILDYTVAKYMEIPYAGCILVAERPNARDTELIGFRDGYNCLFIDGQDESKVRKVYADILAGGYPYMAARGQQLVLSRHTASHRLAYMKRLILWYKVHRRVPNYEEHAELFIQ